MNYKQRKPIPQDELDKMRKNAKGYYIDNIPDYPKNNTHLRAYTDIDLGFDIVYNADGYILKYNESGESILQSENMWTVLASDMEMFRYNEEFNTIEEAISYAYKSYEKHIKAEYENRIEALMRILDIRKGY